MPVKSKSQLRWLFATESRRELPRGTARRWIKETKGKLKNLPEAVPKKASFFDLGLLSIFEKLSSRRKKVKLKDERRRGIFHPTRGLDASSEDGSAGNFSFTPGTTLSEEPHGHLPDGSPSQYKE